MTSIFPAISPLEWTKTSKCVYEGIHYDHHHVLCAHVSDFLCDSSDCSPPGSMEVPRQEYWSGFPFPSPGELPDPGIEPASPATSHLEETLLYH